MNETRTDYRSLLDKEYLGSWDVPEGETLQITITGVSQREVVGENGRKAPCVVAETAETKPMILNITNCKTLATLFKSPYIENWRGPVLVGVEKVRFGGKMVDGLRIKSYLPKTEKLVCVDCGRDIQSASGKKPVEIAQSTQRRYGRCLCAACATAEADKRKLRQAETPEGQLAALIG